MRELVKVHVSQDVPIRLQSLGFADRVEVRFGKAFPVALLVDRAALDRFIEVLQTGRDELDAQSKERG
ncbi:hypothetical protein [Gandjariella thermophila]|uniref:Uncharacterized protein n=1 Tax=Gandjariella thermophila TaxID=1931992 RepID=A0A4D4J8K9_9PSEU|nr:hypothetical protein [Gandjariella thermophila]GDY33001.1 hypothetical protein GTS_46340 [Gandjariella thermophila]